MTMKLPRELMYKITQHRSTSTMYSSEEPRGQTHLWFRGIPTLQRFNLQMRERRFTQASEMKNMAHTLPLMEPLPPQLSLLHECIQSYIRMSHSRLSETCTAMPVTQSTAQQRCFSLLLIPHSSAKLCLLRESDVCLIPVSFHVSVCLLPLLSC